MRSEFAVRSLACLSVIVLTCASPSAAQQRDAAGRVEQAPARDNSARPARGTSIIRGRAIAANGNRPLRRVQIRATAPELGTGQPRATSTDEAGEYEFTDLPAGRYVITASRGGFLTQRYGERRPRELGKIVDVGESQVASDIDFALPKMSIISGRVTDEDGDPIAGVNVLAMRSIYIAGRRQIVPTGDTSVRTDDVGEFRIGDLIPGTYVVSGRTVEKWSVGSSGAQETMGYAPTYFPGTTNIADAARIVVGIEPTIGQRDPGMAGAFRDRYTPVTPSSEDGSFVVQHVFGPAPLTVTVPDGWMVSAITHGGRDAIDSPIALRNGEQLPDVVVTLTNRVTTVSGTLTDSAGAPLANGTIVVFAADRQKWFEGSRFVRTVRPDQKGRYQIKGLPVGEYFAAALDYVEDGAWNEPEYLDTIQRYAQKVTLDDEQPRTISLVPVTIQ